MMAAILNLAYLDSAILVFPLRLTHTCQEWFPPIAQKNSLIYSDSTWWWQPSCILLCWIQTLPSWIQTPCYLLSDSLKNTLTPLWLLTKTTSIWLTWWWQPSSIFYLGFNHFAQKNFTHSFSCNLMMAAILNSAILDSDTAILDSDTLLFSLRFTQKHSHFTLTLT